MMSNHPSNGTRMMKLILFMTIVGAILSHSAQGETFTLGCLAPSPEDLMDNIQGPAINIAIETFQANGWLQEHDFK